MTQQFPQPPLPSESPKKRRRWVWWLGGAFGVLVVLAIIGNIVGPPPARNSAGSTNLTTTVDAPPTTTAASTTTAAPTTTTTTVVTTQAPPVTTTEAQSPPPAPAPVQPEVKTCTVPDVVGMVHQNAQDTMQAAGLFMLREVDATGQGRVLVVDRNWKTVSQSVPAGSVVDCMTEVVLSAKKLDE